MNVSAIIVTRGNVDLEPIFESFPAWETIVWDNSGGVGIWDPKTAEWIYTELPNSDLSVYGRYAAIEYASHDLIYVQDDDVIVSDPQAIAQAWRDSLSYDLEGPIRRSDHIVANMPQEFRHDGYTDSCLVGFGACFHRDLPARAFERVFLSVDYKRLSLDLPAPWRGEFDWNSWPHGFDKQTWLRTCDVFFTTLTPRVLVDVPKTDREFASDDDRMWKQPGHYGERTRILELARMVRDG